MSAEYNSWICKHAKEIHQTMPGSMINRIRHGHILWKLKRFRCSYALDHCKSVIFHMQLYKCLKKYTLTITSLKLLPFVLALFCCFLEENIVIYSWNMKWISLGQKKWATFKNNLDFMYLLLDVPVSCSKSHLTQHVLKCTFLCNRRDSALLVHKTTTRKPSVQVAVSLFHDSYMYSQWKWNIAPFSLDPFLQLTE